MEKLKSEKLGGIWSRLAKPILGLAPMANVTDTVFRRIIAKYGKPDIFFTEFVSCDGLCSEGKEKLLVDLQYTEEEHPIIAQFFGAKPEYFYRCAELAQEMGFDGIDINMGCPDRGVEKQGAGAALMKNPALAKEIIRETKRGAGALPVSVKTRLGYNKESLDEWIPSLLEEEPVALTIHARTRKEMSLVPARWSDIKKAVEIVKKSGSNTLVLGNGDVKDVVDAVEKIRESGADGALIGRGIFGNPWLFNKERDYRDIPLDEKLRVLVEHAFLFEKELHGVKNFEIMKKHFKAYASGFDEAKELRIKLMSVNNALDVQEIVDEWLSRHSASMAAEALQSV